jgi:hypothetical protein
MEPYTNRKVGARHGRTPSESWLGSWSRGVKPRSPAFPGPNRSWRWQKPESPAATMQIHCALKLNSIEPPRYVTRMPGGVGGAAP